MSDTHKNPEVEMLRQEIEMLMSERQNLLRVTGAAAAFVANMDSKSLPEDTYEAAELLAEGLNALSEDTLREALEVVRAQSEEKAKTKTPKK